MKKLSLATILLLSTASIVTNAEMTTQQASEKDLVVQKGEKHQGKHHHKKFHERKERGGFVDPTNPQASKDFSKALDEKTVNLISDKANWKDEQHVVLQGKLIKQTAQNNFLFRDSSGEIEVEIKPRAWKGERITPSDEVKILAKVDKSDSKFELEVHRIVKIAKVN